MVWAGSSSHEIHTNPHKSTPKSTHPNFRLRQCLPICWVGGICGHGLGVAVVESGLICPICDCLVWMGCVDDGWCLWLWVGFVIVVSFFNNNNNDGFAGSRQVWHGLCGGGSPFLHWLRVAGGGVTNILWHGLTRTSLQCFVSFLFSENSW